MVEVRLKTSPQQSNWFANDENTNLNPEGYRWRLSLRQHLWRPPTDVFETEDALVVRVEIAGMQEADCLVTLAERYLVIRGFRPDTTDRKAFHQMEIPFGEFSTEVELPFMVDAEQIDAVYRDGFLRVVLPKARPYEVKIED